MRKFWIGAGALAAVALLAPGCRVMEQLSPSEVVGKVSGPGVEAVHETVFTLDSHVDIPFDYMSPDADPGSLGSAQVDLPKMRDGGLDGAFFIVYVPQRERTAGGYARAKQQALTKFAAIQKMVEVYPDDIELALKAADAQRISDSGKLVAFIGVENGYSIGEDLSLIEDFYNRGARYLSLTHNGHTALADSAIVRLDLKNAKAEHQGVSPLGEQAIAEMNRLGVMVDVAHASKDTVLDAARMSKAPIISSHHALKHFVDIPRNMTDEELIAIARTGGVVQLVAFDTYVRPVDPERRTAHKELAVLHGIRSREDFYSLTPQQRRAYVIERRRLDKKYVRGSLPDLVDQIDYAVRLVGIDHVGIASDFDGGGGVIGWDDASETLNMTAEMYKRGYSRAEIAKLWGGNLLRVLADVEEVAQGYGASQAEVAPPE